MNNDHATKDNPLGRFRAGTRIEIAGHPVKAENGTFEMNTPFMAQPNGDAYLQWSRVMKNGKRTESVSTSNLRGGRASTLEAMIDVGQCRIISEPAIV